MRFGTPNGTVAAEASLVCVAVFWDCYGVAGLRRPRWHLSLMILGASAPGRAAACRSLLLLMGGGMRVGERAWRSPGRA